MLRRITHFGTAVATAGAVVAGLAGAPVAVADPPGRDYFLNELHKTGQKWYWPYGEDYIVGVGQDVCDAWNDGSSYSAEVDQLATTQGWTHRNTRYFVALATGAFCPELFESVVPPQDRPSDAGAPRS